MNMKKQAPSFHASQRPFHARMLRFGSDWKQAPIYQGLFLGLFATVTLKLLEQRST